MNNDNELAKYIAAYIAEELERSASPTLWSDDLNEFADNLPDMMADGIAAFRGGATDGYETRSK